MLKSATLFSLTIFFLFFSGCESKGSNTTHENKTQPLSKNFSLHPVNNPKETIEIVKTQNGFKLKNDPQKILIFDIFATWCVPCRAEAAVLTNIQKKYKNDVIVVGLPIEEEISDEKLATYQKKYNVGYIIASSKNTQKLIDAIAADLDITQRFPIPLVAMYKNGKLVNYYAGAVEEEFIQSDIKQVIGK